MKLSHSDLERLWAKVDRRSPEKCWEWKAGKCGNGYGTIWMGTRRQGGKVYAHRLTYELSHGQIPEGLFVLHRCDNPSCVNPSHLFVGTAGDNIRDAYSKGRRKGPRRFGEANHSAKLTDQAVREIRRLWSSGAFSKQADLVRYLGIPQPTVSRVLLRRSWTHI